MNAVWDTDITNEMTFKALFEALMRSRVPLVSGYAAHFVTFMENVVKDADSYPTAFHIAEVFASPEVYCDATDFTIHANLMAKAPIMLTMI